MKTSEHLKIKKGNEVFPEKCSMLENSCVHTKM